MNNKTDIDVQYVSPLKKICMTIGELPSSYLETMSYYEMLVWFTEFLKNQVIPTVNNNAEAVQELQSLYEELRTYVNNYFDNLDVQEEINNKLDEMADSGQLTDIIAQYLGLAGMIAFDTVADMKLAQNLVNGSKCRTLGFYSVNDGGGAYYKIRTVTNDDVIDEMTIIEVYDDLLVAELLEENEMNVKQFGAYGDGTHDDTTPIQTAINSFKSITIPYGTYMTTGVSLKDDSIINSKNATLKIIPNNLTSYFVVQVTDVDNVSVLGKLNCIGDKDTHTGSSGEYGMAFGIMGSSNIYIEDLNLSYGWGDGLYIGNSESLDNQNNIYINNVTCHHNRRNGMSIISGEKLTINNLVSYSNGGTSPHGGFDIEPYRAENKIDVIINNAHCYDNLSTNFHQAYVSNAYTDNFNVNIGTLKVVGDLSVTITKDKSNLTIDNLLINTQSSQNKSPLILTSWGIVKIKNCEIDISNTSSLTNVNVIYSEKMLNSFIDNLTVINNGESLPYFIVNSANITNFNINNLTFIGLLKKSSTRSTYIKINNMTKKSKTLTTSDSNLIPFITDITISDELNAFYYDDVAQYDGYEINVTNTNSTTTCTFSLNQDRFLYNGNKVYSISLPPSTYAKVKFDLFSHLYVVQYIYTVA